MSPATVPKGTTDQVMARLFPQPNPHLADPVGWIRDRLGEHTWSKQVQVAESVRDHRYTAVQSAHSTGKSFIASRLIAWWIETHDPGDAFVVSTAPSQIQTEAILWREIGKAHRQGGLTGRITGGMVPQWKLGQEIVGYGRKPQDLTSKEEAMAAFSGIHARFVLIVMDEAGGIPRWLWDAVDTLATNESARVLAIGNPDDPSSHFATVCSPGSGWAHHTISAFDTPAFTDEQVPADLYDVLVSREWVEERKARWGPKSALYTSKVLGQFPEAAEDSMIGADLVRRAQKMDLSGEALGDYGRYGWDIGEFGTDETVGYLNQGGMVRRVFTAVGQDTMRTAGDIMAEAAKYPIRTHVVDRVGVGSGVYSRLAEQDVQVHGFAAGERALRPDRFKNRRAEVWWTLRELMRDGLVDLDAEDEELASQLQAPKWWRDSAGRVVLEPKDKMAKRGVSSPDRADAVAMAFVAPAQERKPLEEVVVPSESITAGVLDEPM